MPKPISRLDALTIIFKHPTYIISTLVSAGIFYYIFYYLIVISNKGVFLVTLPISLVYALVLTSGILFSISLYLIARSILTKLARYEGSIAGILLPSVGGLIASCSCSFSILAALLTFLGINAFDAVSYVSVINSYQIYLFVILILANIILIYFYLGKVANFFRKKK